MTDCELISESDFPLSHQSCRATLVSINCALCVWVYVPTNTCDLLWKFVRIQLEMLFSSGVRNDLENRMTVHRNDRLIGCHKGFLSWKTLRTFHGADDCSKKIVDKVKLYTFVYHPLLQYKISEGFHAPFLKLDMWPELPLNKIITITSISSSKNSYLNSRLCKVLWMLLTAMSCLPSKATIRQIAKIVPAQNKHNNSAAPYNWLGRQR